MTTLDKHSKALQEKNVELTEDEQVDYLVKRHWLSLFLNMIIPTVITIGSLGFFLYRMVGGTFIQWHAELVNTFDAVNIILTIFFVIAVALIMVTSRGKKKKNQLQGSLTTLLALLGLLIYYRYQGGRLFFIDSDFVGKQAFDIYNILLLAVVVVGGIFCFYLHYEWDNDFLILTNQRVIVWYEKLWGKHTQDQIYIDDIQNVIANRATYLQYWLNFGSIQVTSAAYRTPLEFRFAVAPQDMQGKIMGKVNANRQQQSKENFDAIIQEKVYGTPPAKQQPKPKLKTVKKPPLIDFLFYDNPQIVDNGMITWRQHWIFLPIVAIRPVVALILSFIALFILNSITPIGILAMVGLSLLIVSAFFVWAWYVIEDERNELYILQPTALVDVEKDPLGPEKRNTASLASVQNVKFNTTLLGRMVGYGDVVIETAGTGGQMMFPRLPNPAEVVTTINDYRVRFKKSEKERSLNDTISLLKHYHNLEEQRRKDEDQHRRNEVAQPAPEITKPQGSSA